MAFAAWVEAVSCHVKSVVAVQKKDGVRMATVSRISRTQYDREACTDVWNLEVEFPSLSIQN
jgi:hypothetical protein